MIVYIETNFVLELVFAQEQHRSCEQMLALCEPGDVNLVVPAYCLAEPNEKLRRQEIERKRLQQDLQVNRETVYRYIRQGKLVASKLGRSYRVPRRSLDLLLWATRTREDISLREYTGQEISEFIAADQLDEDAQEIAQRFLAANSIE